jgi:hypothetical protein
MRNQSVTSNIDWISIVIYFVLVILGIRLLFLPFRYSPYLVCLRLEK